MSETVIGEIMSCTQCKVSGSYDNNLCEACTLLAMKRGLLRPQVKQQVSPTGRVMERLRRELLEHTTEALRMSSDLKLTDYHTVSAVANQLHQAARNADRLQALLHVAQLEKL